MSEEPTDVRLTDTACEDVMALNEDGRTEHYTKAATKLFELGARRTTRAVQRRNGYNVSQLTKNELYMQWRPQGDSIEVGGFSTDPTDTLNPTGVITDGSH